MNNSQKLSIAGQISERSRAAVLQHVQNLSGKAPATIKSIDKTNTILTLKFETDPQQYSLPDVTVPVHGSEYIRHPYKVGDKGYVSAADFDIGNMTALGDQNPSKFTRPGNLSSLIWNPVGNKDFSETDNPQALLGYGPKGTIHRDTDKKCQVTTNPDVGAKLQAGDSSGGDDHHVVAKSGDGVTHKSSVKVTTDAPTHNVTGSQNVAQNLSVSGASSFSGGISGGMQNALGGLLHIGDGAGGGGVGADSLATNAAAGNLGLIAGLPVYPTQAAALAALGPGHLYVNSSVGQQSVTVTGGAGGTVSLPSFYSQGIFVVCVTSHG